MKYRKLGASDLEVSEISLGSWLTYGVGVARENAVACVDRAFELGINFIDTANVYGRGAAETFLGEVLARRPRDSYILATKLYFPMSATDSGLSRAQIAKQIDASLQRLRRRSCRSLSVPSLRQRHADRGDHAGPEQGGARRQGSLHRLQRMVAAADRSRVRGGRQPSASSRASRNTRCSGASPSRRSFPSARPRGFPRSSGRRWRRACCRASTCPARRDRPGRAPAMRRWASPSSPGSAPPSWAPCKD